MAYQKYTKQITQGYRYMWLEKDGRRGGAMLYVESKLLQWGKQNYKKRVRKGSMFKIQKQAIVTYSMLYQY